MNIVPILLTLLPIIVIFLLLIMRWAAADVAGLAGWVIVAFVAWLYFRTPLAIVFNLASQELWLRCPLRWLWQPRFFRSQ